MRRGMLVVTLVAAGVTITAVMLHRGDREEESRATRPKREPAPEVIGTVDPPAEGEQGATATANEGGSPLPPISGEVVDATTGDAIAGATVCALAEGKVVAEAIAGAGGAFSLDVLESRRYALNAAAAGHVHAQIQALLAGEDLNAEPGAHVRISLEPALRIRGTVVDQGGSGLGNATIRSASVYLETKERSVLYMVESTSSVMARTDALGRFEISEVPPRGRSRYLVRLDGYDDGMLSVDPAAMPAPPEYVVRLNALPVLAGRIAGEDGRPLPGVAVLPLGEGPGLVVSGTPVLTADDGTFRYAWRPRATSLLAWGFGFIPAIVPVRPNDLLRGSLFEVRLHRAGEIAGVVRDDRGLPVAEARVRVHHYDMLAWGRRGRLFPPFVRAYTEEPGVEWFMLLDDPTGCVCAPEAITDSNGSFLLAGAAPGQVGTFLLADKDGYVEASSGWKEGSPSMFLKLVRAARVVVAAVDARTGEPVPEFRIVVQHPTAAMVSRTNTATGEPTAAFVEPGSLKITVDAKGYVSDTVTVELPPGQELVCRFPLNPK